MSPLNAFYISVAIVISAKTVAWLLQLRTRNAGLVDAIWAWTLGGLAAFYGAVGSAPQGTRVLLGLMGGLWGLRLGTHLWRRNYGKPEDFRYANFREKWGTKAAADTAPEQAKVDARVGGSTTSRTRCFANTVSVVDFNMFWFFQFQNLFTLMLSASAFMAIAYRPDAPSSLAILSAGLIWLVSVVGEALADAQMEAFRQNPANKGRVCRDGLWRWSRHPNYFFECLHWVAYVPLACGAPWGWTALAAPLVMAFLVTKLSGMPILEAEMAKRKPGYADYIKTTSALIPWPPKEP